MVTTPLSQIKIILVEPAGPLNVGSVARIMKNMGFSQLVLVNPQCNYEGEEARKMAVHAVDLLENCQVVSDLPQALKGCQRAIATTAVTRSLMTELEPPQSSLSWLLNHPSGLIFGRESRGLTNEELNYAQRFVKIPSSEVYSSLNLAQSVGICCYELYQQSTQISSPISPPVNSLFPSELQPSVSLDELENYYGHLENLLLKIGYLYPHTTSRRMEKIRRIYNRASLSSEEVAMLRGMLRQIEWAIESYPRLQNPPVL